MFRHSAAAGVNHLISVMSVRRVEILHQYLSVDRGSWIIFVCHGDKPKPLKPCGQRAKLL